MLFRSDNVGPIDILVANAGMSVASPADQMDASVFETVMATNFTGAVNCFDAVIPQMIKRKQGQLVSISSLASFRGLPQSGAYCASKAALSTMTESMRIDLKPHNIDVSLIFPGFIKTPLTDRNQYKMPLLMGTDKGVEEIFKAIQRKKLYYAFPAPLSILVKSLRFLPVRLYDRAMSNVKNKKSPMTTSPSKPVQSGS